jgi:hypothetical protein
MVFGILQNTQNMAVLNITGPFRKDKYKNTPTIPDQLAEASESASITLDFWNNNVHDSEVMGHKKQEWHILNLFCI